MEILPLVETASKTLAPTKPEMMALLGQWKALAMQEKNPDPTYPDGLNRAINVLEKSASVPELLAKLRRLESKMKQ